MDCACGVADPVLSDCWEVTFTFNRRWKKALAVLILVGGIAVGVQRGPEPVPHGQQTPYIESVQPPDRPEETHHNDRVEPRSVGEVGKGVASFTRIYPNLVIPQ